MYTITENSDWQDVFDFSGTNYGQIQPGHSVIGTVGGEDTTDLVQISLAVGEPYTFEYEGDVSVTILDYDTDTTSPSYTNTAPVITANSVTFTSEHPSDPYTLAVSGTGQYEISWAGIAADHLPDEDLGNMETAPALEIGTATTGVINGTDVGGGLLDFTPETDYYQFTAVAGQTYNFSMTQASSPYGSTSGGLLSLYDENGDSFTTGVGSSASAWDDGATLSFTPDETQTFYLGAETYFGYFGGYVLQSHIGDDAPGANVSLSDPTLVTPAGANPEIEVTISLDTIAANEVTGTIALTLVDTNYSVDASQDTMGFSIAAGAQTATIRVPVADLPIISHETNIVASLEGVDGAGIETGFGELLYETPVSAGPTTGDDHLVGTGGADVLKPLAGDDVVEGLGGNDLLVGGQGADTIWGGGGNDSIWAGSGDDAGDSIDAGLGDDILGGGAGHDTLIGNDGNDTLFGGSGDDLIEGGTGDDVSWAGDGDDSVGGGEGDNTLGGGLGNDTITSGSGHDTIYGGVGTGADSVSSGAGNDTIYTGGGSDTIRASAGNDLMFNGAGSDDVDGGAGEDTLWGGPGDDTLTGGGDADSFRFTVGNGTDTITDFEVGVDEVAFSETGLAFEDLVFTDTAPGVEVSYGADTVVFSGLTSADLGAGDFIFV